MEYKLKLNFLVVNNTKKLPVLIFIHGGSFVKGTADDINHGPDFLVEQEIILITISYRLGVLGFMSLGTPEYSGNMGLKDQQIALKWIYDNIESFGGDKTQITLSGHSAGIFAIEFLCVIPKCTKKANAIFNELNFRFYNGRPSFLKRGI